MEFEPRLSEHRRGVQPVEGLRSEFFKTFGRGNLRNQIQFSRVEQHADNGRAIFNALAIPQAWPSEEDVCDIRILASPGTVAEIEAGPWPMYRVKIHDACIVSAPGRAHAMFTYHTVTIIGGEMEIVTAPV